MSKFIDSTSYIDEKSEIADNVKIYRNAKIIESRLNSNCSIGDDSIIRYSKFDNKVEIGRRSTIDHVSIGLSTYTGDSCHIKYCSIGKYCSISWNVTIGGANHEIDRISSAPLHRIFPNTDVEEYKSFKNESIVVGNDVWIGANATICRGVIIESGAVIAAGSVVTKDVPAFAVVAGVPAKIIKYRFEENIIKDLIELKWWDWDIDRLNKAKTLFENKLDSSTIEKLKRIK